jgi:chromosome segregation ATPase
MLMRECKYCGKPIVRRKQKGGREREYCNDVCRQMAYRARHPEMRYVIRAMRRFRTEQWKKDPHLLPWQEELEAAKKQIKQLKNDVTYLESANSLLSSDLFRRDEELRYLRWQLGEAQVEITRLNVLLDGQSKRKH